MAKELVPLLASSLGGSVNALGISSVPGNSKSLTVASEEAYIRSIQHVPMLTFEEEQSLAKQFREEGDIEAAKKLVLSHLRLVVSIVRGYEGYGLSRSDLVQEGNIGLMKAVKRFDPSRGVRLVSFAMHWIKAEINEYVLKNWRIVKLATSKAQRKLFFNLRSLKSQFKRLTLKESKSIAADLKVSQKDVEEMEIRMGGQDVAFDRPLDQTDSDDGKMSFSPDQYLSSSEESYEPLALLENKEMEELGHKRLYAALDELDERSRFIIQNRWLSEQDSNSKIGMTLSEIGEKYQISPERVRQVEAQAMKKLKAAITGDF